VLQTTPTRTITVDGYEETLAVNALAPFLLTRLLLPLLERPAPVFMAVDASLDGVGGKFFGERHEIESSPESRDVGKARRFWDLAARPARID
jgi:NAD(P)-dependent dehydrogenase (short-subunit alcohol dehydrogenase family)